MHSHWQALCWCDKGLSTCWRPGTIAQNIVCTAMADAHFTPIRYCQV